MKIYIFLLLVFIPSSLIFCQSDTMSYLAPVSLGEKEGVIDLKDGKIVIPIEFDDIRDYSKTLIGVNIGATGEYSKKGGKWGFWSRDGKEVIPIQYEEIGSFSEGFVAVKKEDKWGYINEVGETIVEFKYEGASSFSEGLAAVKMEGKWGFIDKKGNIKIAFDYGRVEAFDQGYSVVFHKEGQYEENDDGYEYIEEYGTYGMIDSLGNMVLDTLYDYISYFKNGYARITLNDDEAYGYNQKEGLINKKGEIVIPIEYEGIYPFSEGLAVVSKYLMKEGEDFGFEEYQIDSLEQELMQLYDFYQGDESVILDYPAFKMYQKAKMQEPSEELMYGYINESGELVIDFQFDNAEPFKNGLAKVRFGKQQMFRMVLEDSEGNRLPTPYDESGKGENLIDKKGNLLLATNQHFINRYADSIFIANNYVGSKAMTENNEVLDFGKNINVSYLGNGLFLAQSFGKNKGETTMTIFNRNEQKIFEHNCAKMKLASPNRLIVREVIRKQKFKKMVKVGVMDLEGNWIVAPIYDSIYFYRKR